MLSGRAVRSLYVGQAGAWADSGQVVGFQLKGFALEPICQFARPCKHTCAISERYAMHGQPTFSLPALHRSFASIEKGRNLFPTVQSSSQGKIFLFGSAFRERRQASASVLCSFPPSRHRMARSGTKKHLQRCRGFAMLQR